MRLLRLVPAVLLVGTLCVSSASGLDSSAPVPMLTAMGVARTAPDPSAPVAPVAAAVTGLGYRMRALAGPGNWVASPLSVAYAFAMLRAGAGPSTAEALERTFQFPATGLDA